MEKTNFVHNYHDLLRPEILSRVPITARRILDVGCGTGDLAGYLAGRGLSVHYTGVDLLERMVEDIEQSRAQLEEQAGEMAGLAEEQAALREKAETATKAKASFLAAMSHEISTVEFGVQQVTVDGNYFMMDFDDVEALRTMVQSIENVSEFRENGYHRILNTNNYIIIITK